MVRSKKAENRKKRNVLFIYSLFKCYANWKHHLPHDLILFLRPLILIQRSSHEHRIRLFIE